MSRLRSFFVVLPTFTLTVLFFCTLLPVKAQIYTPQRRIGGRAGGTDAPGKFLSVVAIALDNKENLYVASDYSVQKFDRTGKFLLKFGKRGTGAGQFEWGIGGMAVDKSGNIYLSDWSGHRVHKFGKNGNFLSTLGTRGTGPRQFEQPHSLAVDQAGNLLVIDAKNHRLQKFDGSGRFLASMNPGARVKRPTVKYTPDNDPTAITVGPDGNIYIAYEGGGFVQKLSASGKELKRVTGFDGSPRIALDKTGKLYVLDTISCRVQIFSPTGVLVSKFRAPDPRVSLMPTGIAVDSKGDIFLGASGNGMAYVQKFRRRYLAP